MKRWIMLPVVSLLIVAVFVVFVRRGVAARRDAPPRLDADTSTADELGALRREVDSLKNKSEMPRVQYVARETVAPSPAAPPPSAAPSQSPEEAEQRHREAFAELEARFAAETIDSSWSVNTVREIKDAITANASGTQLVEAECATSLCRIVLSHDDAEAQKQLGFSLVNQASFQVGVMYDYDYSSTPPKTTLLVLREGHSFRDEH
jgi:hypothetical protein